MTKPPKNTSDMGKDSDRKTSGPTRSKTIWSGSISFGLVNIPVTLVPGIKTKDVRFHLLHEKDKSRLNEKLICPVDQEEIPRSEAIKGYEIGKGQHVIVSPEEITSLAPKATRTIELTSVVDIHQIDPMFFDRPYYLLPDDRAVKPYLLLVEALQSAKKGAIAKFVMRGKEYIGAIRPIKKVLCLDTLHFADEIIPVNELSWQAPNIPMKDAEMKMALQLLDSLATTFQPSQLHDDFRDALLQLIQKKASGKNISIQPEVEDKAPEVIDLMDALKKSLAISQRQKRRRAA